MILTTARTRYALCAASCVVLLCVPLSEARSTVQTMEPQEATSGQLFHNNKLNNELNNNNIHKASGVEEDAPVTKPSYQHVPSSNVLVNAVSRLMHTYFHNVTNHSDAHADDVVPSVGTPPAPLGNMHRSRNSSSVSPGRPIPLGPRFVPRPDDLKPRFVKRPKPRTAQLPNMTVLTHRRIIAPITEKQRILPSVQRSRLATQIL